MKTLSGLAVLAILAAAAGEIPVRRGFLHSRVTGLRGQSFPRELTVRVRPSLELAGQENPGWETTMSCPVQGMGMDWTCEVPAGRVDLRILGASALPIYRWGVAVRPGRTVDLGTWRLQRGASLSGWVRPSRKEILTHSVLVELVPLRVGKGMIGLEPKPIRATLLALKSRPWGFFRFDTLPPGEYAVLASEPGLPRARFGPVRIEGETVTELTKPILLVPPITFQGRIVTNYEATGKTWNLALRPEPQVPNLDSGTQAIKAKSNSPWKFTNLAAGTYTLTITTEEGRSFVTYGTQTIHLEPENTFSEIRISTQRVRGLVTYQGKPLAAHLNFGGNGSSFLTQSDEQGQFSIDLVAGTTWKIRVAALDGTFRLILQDPIRASGWAEIRVPDTRLPVDVLDPTGRRVIGAQVQVLGKIPNQFSVDSLGHCEIVGLRPGPQQLQAIVGSPPRKGEIVTIDLKEGERTRPLRLVLPDVLDLRGRIEPPFGFAPGARVLAWPVDAQGQTTAWSTYTDEDGDFRLSLPAGLRKANFAVLAPGSALRLLEAEVSQTRLLEVHMDTHGGTLLLEMPDAFTEDEKPKPGTPPTLTLPRLLRQWADSQGTPQHPGLLVVPNVEPGPYTLCATETTPLLRRGEPPAGNPYCTGGALEAGGELRLRLPE